MPFLAFDAILCGAQGGQSGLHNWVPRDLEQTDAAYSSGDVVYKQDNMKFDAPQAQIQLDGSFLDWQCADIKAQTPFYPYNQRANQEGSHCCGNKLTMFDDCTCPRIAFLSESRPGSQRIFCCTDGGQVAWDSSDHSVAMSFAWDPSTFCAQQ